MLSQTLTFFFIAYTLSLLPVSRAGSGCGSTTSWSFDSDGHANRTMSDRSFYVHIPQSYDRNVSYPLVLSFHAFANSEAYQEHISGFSQDGLEIDGKGIIAVYPRGSYGTRNALSWQGAPYAKPGVDDVEFTRKIVRAVQANLCVDPNRIYAAGKSNGGGLVNLLACTNDTSSMFAAYAPVSAALYSGTHPFEDCQPSRPVPIINFHGLADDIAPFGGRSTKNPSYSLPSIADWRKAWATRDGCSNLDEAVNKTRLSSERMTEDLWNCSPSGIFQGYSVEGLGHTWPTTQGLDMKKTAAFNATPTYIIPFFQQYRLDHPPVHSTNDNVTPPDTGSAPVVPIHGSPTVNEPTGNDASRISSHIITFAPFIVIALIFV